MRNSNKLPSRSNGYGKTAGYDLFGMERSECLERICCGPNRSLVEETFWTRDIFSSNE